jgi:hypothetical protein
MRVDRLGTSARQHPAGDEPRHAPGSDDFFSVNHRFDSDRARITVHRFSDPQEVTYSDGYDKGYEGIIGVVEVPNDDLLIISVQRDSHPVLYDPRAREKVGTLELCNRVGNPNLFFRRRANELWADDYDTVVKLEPVTWRVLGSRLVQPPTTGTNGQFSFYADESLCAVARPFSRDVLGSDSTTLQTRFQCALDGQPIEAVVLPDRSVSARDWKSGTLPRVQWQAST